MNLRQAAQQALEALEWVWGGEPLTGKELDAITALRAALAESEQEPVAWMQEMPVSGNEERSVRMTTVKMVADEWDNPIPLYTAPTTQHDTDCHAQGICQRSGYSTAPAPCRPLTDEEIDGLRLTTGYAAGLERFTVIARAIERAHGIAGEGA